MAGKRSMDELWKKIKHLFTKGETESGDNASLSPTLLL